MTQAKHKSELEKLLKGIDSFIDAQHRLKSEFKKSLQRISQKDRNENEEWYAIYRPGYLTYLPDNGQDEYFFVTFEDFEPGHLDAVVIL